MMIAASFIGGCDNRLYDRSWLQAAVPGSPWPRQQYPQLRKSVPRTSAFYEIRLLDPWQLTTLGAGGQDRT